MKEKGVLQKDFIILKKVVIIYFSGTGNTRFVMDALSYYLKKYDIEMNMIKAEESIQSLTSIVSYDMIGFAFPVYGHDYPHEIFDPVLNAIQDVDKKKAFIVSTSWKTPGMAMNHFASTIHKKGFDIVLKEHFLCPSNGWICLSDPESKKVKDMYFEHNLFGHANEVAKKINDIYESKNYQSYRFNFSSPKEKFLTKLSTNIENNLWTDFKINNEKCIKCYKCYKGCPMHNIKIVNTEVQFKSDACARCQRCMCLCPVDAITLGDKTVGKPRYNSDERIRRIKKYIQDIPKDFFLK